MNINMNMNMNLFESQILYLILEYSDIGLALNRNRYKVQGVFGTNVQGKIYLIWCELTIFREANILETVILCLPASEGDRLRSAT
jgi:hypothetical protein